MIQILKGKWGAWTGLHDGASTYEHPSQMHPTCIFDAQKNYDVCAKDLLEFRWLSNIPEVLLETHLEKCRLDTIGYVLDLINKQMMSVVLYHSSFSVKDQIKNHVALHDTFTEYNDHGAATDRKCCGG